MATDMLDSLSTERDRIQTLLASALDFVVATEAVSRHATFGHYRCAKDCALAEHRIQVLVDVLHRRRIWPLSNTKDRPLELVMKGMEAANLLSDLSFQSIEPCDEDTCVGLEMDWLDTILHRIEKGRRDALLSMKTLCYQCARAGKVFDPYCAHAKEKT